MKTQSSRVQVAKAAEAQRKSVLNERLNKEAQAASERIRTRFDAERQALARRYGVVSPFSSETDKI